MNPKQLTILAVLVAAAAVAFFIVNSKQDKAINRESAQKIGDAAVAAMDVPSITSLSLAKTGQAVTLKKEGDAWVVSERDNYPADANKIRGVLYSLKDMKISESRNLRGPAALKALELLDPATADAGGSGTGTSVTFSSDGESGSLVFGKNFASANGGGGRFILTDDGAVHVVSTSLMNLETDAPAWLDKTDFFAVEKAQTIAIAHEKPEDSFTLVRETDGSSLALQDATAEEELDTAKSSGLSTLFGNGKFTDYIAGDAAKPEATGLDKPITVTVDTFNGFKYIVSIGKKTDDSKYYLSYQVSAEIAEVPAEPEPEAEPAAPEEGKELTEEEKAAQAAEKAKQEEDKAEREKQRAEAERLKKKLATEQKNAAKVYTVYSAFVQSAVKKRGEILKTAEDKKKEAEAAANPGAGGGNNPSVISQGPDGKKRITATTPPISIDPQLLEAERLKQEKAVIEKQKADNDAAAIRKMIDDHKRELEAAEKDKAKVDPDGAPAPATDPAEDPKAEE